MRLGTSPGSACSETARPSLARARLELHGTTRQNGARRLMDDRDRRYLLVSCTHAHTWTVASPPHPPRCTPKRQSGRGYGRCSCLLQLVRRLVSAGSGKAMMIKELCRE